MSGCFVVVAAEVAYVYFSGRGAAYVDYELSLVTGSPDVELGGTRC